MSASPGKRKKKTILTDEQIANVRTIYNNWQSTDRTLYKDVPELCKSVRLSEPDGIRDKDYALMPSKYIRFINHDELIDTKKEMESLSKEIHAALLEEQETVRLLKLAAEEVRQC